MTNPTYARHSGQIYNVIGGTSTHVTLMHPSASGDHLVNIGTWNMPVIVPGLINIERAKADFFKDLPVAPMPAIPFGGGLQVGARCKWGTSLAQWVVMSIDGDTAKVRQCSGWNQAMAFDAPASELIVLSDRATEVREAA